MILKLIRAFIKPGQKEEFIRKQRIWNDAMSRQPGFLGVQVATDPQAPDEVVVLIAMESREALDRFMKGDHDVIASEAESRSTYHRLEIRVLDVIEPGPQEIRLDPAASRAGSGYQIALLSELYRVSAAVRAAITGGIFELIGDGATLDEVAARSGSTTPYVQRLVEGLAAVNLVELEGERVTLKPLAARHLCRGAEGYMGDLFLHNTRPGLWQRWGGLDARLHLGARESAGDEHVLFLRAMSAIAEGGQTAALLSGMAELARRSPRLSLTGRRRLLDIGGARGDYAIALCARYPELEGVVFDQPQSESSARAQLAASGVADRVTFIAGDYRAELPGGGYDAVLLSNVLRGETTAEARALVERIARAMAPSGLLLVQDLFVDDPRGHGPLLAALFGLHLPDAMNGSGSEIAELLRSAGFDSITTIPLDGHVISNRLIAAERAP